MSENIAIIEQLRWTDDGLAVTIVYKGATTVPKAVERCLEDREACVSLIRVS